MGKKQCVLFLLLVVSHQTIALGPLIPVLVASAASVMLAGFGTMKCKVYECCTDDWVKPDITGLSAALTKKLHGQHLVIGPLVKAVRGHVTNSNPSKALAISLHGWTGGGKNFVSQILANHLYTKGTESRHHHLFVATLHFPHESKIETYKDQLRDWIRGNVSACPRSLFIFDEMDKMMPNLIDTVKPYLDHYPEINGVSYNKAIFIFISNAAGNDITIHTLDRWKEGKKREDITYKEMEEVITFGSFNQKDTGLWHSSLIDKNLINAFLPFLPMERKHVKLCIKDQLELKGHPVTEDIINKVANELTYFPKELKLYSTSGCKRIAEKVDLIMD